MTQCAERFGLLLALLLIGLVLSVPVLADIVPTATPMYDLSWRNIDGSGDTLSGGIYTLRGTAGQPDAASWGGGAYTLSGGFWLRSVAEPEEVYWIYVPMILRNAS